MSDIDLAVFYSASQANSAEIALAEKIQVPLLQSKTSSETQIEFALEYSADGLVLYNTADRRSSEVRVDFTDPALTYRLGSQLKNQAIARAVGIKPGFRPSVVDATAGLGKDAFLLAYLGCRLSMFERSAVVHALLEDGLERAKVCEHEKIRQLARDMSLANKDFLQLGNADNQADVVYLDPMFPGKSNSARAKKAMYVLQQLLGSDRGTDGLLPKALEIAQKRVVVKRAKSAAYLSNRKPSFELKGSSSRFDVYLTS